MHEFDTLSEFVALCRTRGNTAAETAEHLVQKNPQLAQKPVQLALLLRAAYPVSIRDVHHIAAWVQRSMSQENLGELLGLPADLRHVADSGSPRTGRAEI